MLSRGQVPRSLPGVRGVRRLIPTREAGLQEAECRTQSLPEPRRDCPPNPTSSGRVLPGTPLQLHPTGRLWRTDRRMESLVSARRGPHPTQVPILLSVAARSTPMSPPGTKSMPVPAPTRVPAPSPAQVPWCLSLEPQEGSTCPGPSCREDRVAAQRHGWERPRARWRSACDQPAHHPGFARQKSTSARRAESTTGLVLGLPQAS